MLAATSSFIRDVRWFAEHAGGVVGERILGALYLARAERAAAERGWVFCWEQDPEGCTCDDVGPHEALGCVLREAEPSAAEPRPRVLASLWGICDADAAYRRLVEAELACEALYTEAPTPSAWLAL